LLRLFHHCSTLAVVLAMADCSVWPAATVLFSLIVLLWSAANLDLSQGLVRQLRGHHKTSRLDETLLTTQKRVMARFAVNKRLLGHAASALL